MEQFIFWRFMLYSHDFSRLPLVPWNTIFSVMLIVATLNSFRYSVSETLSSIESTFKAYAGFIEIEKKLNKIVILLFVNWNENNSYTYLRLSILLRIDPEIFVIPMWSADVSLRTCL